VPASVKTRRIEQGGGGVYPVLHAPAESAGGGILCYISTN